MFGTFDEYALAAYAEQVKQKRPKPVQGTEGHDNLGVGEQGCEQCLGLVYF